MTDVSYTDAMRRQQKAHAGIAALEPVLRSIAKLEGAYYQELVASGMSEELAAERTKDLHDMMFKKIAEGFELGEQLASEAIKRQ